MYTGGGNIYKNIEWYNASNWNYLLLINVLNQVKHSEQKIDATLIQDTADLIAKQGKYSKYTSELNNAVHNITEYFNELELYGYLERTRAIKWDDSKFEQDKTSIEHEKTTKADTIRRMQGLFKSIDIYVQADKTKDEQCDKENITIYEVKKGTQEALKWHTINLRNNNIRTQIRN